MVSRIGRGSAAMLAAMALPAGIAPAAGASPTFYARTGSTTPFSPVVRAGDYLFLSGQIGSRPDGSIPPTIAEQTELALGHIRSALAMAGAGLGDIVKCTAMLDDIGKWAEFNARYVAFFAPGRMPARSAFGVRGLALGAGIEIECVAYRPVRRRPAATSRPRAAAARPRL